MKDQEIARLCVRGLALEPGKQVLVDVEAEELARGILGLIESVGAQLTDDAPDAAVIAVDSLDEPILPGRLVHVRSRLEAGVPLVVVTEKGPDSNNIEFFESNVKFRLKLERCRVQHTGDRWLVFGSATPALSAAERKTLRSQGHSIEPSVLVGRAGLTASLIEAIGSALERHGLIKVKLTPQSSENKEDAAVAMAWATGSHLVQRIGKTALLYRADVPLDPPTKRVRRH